MLSSFQKRKTDSPSVAHDEKGIAAVEFALIVPFIIILLLGSVDAVFALTAKRKVALATHSIADIAAREDNLTNSDLIAIASLGRLIMTPYDTSSSRIMISGVTVDATGENADTQWTHSLITNGSSSVIDDDANAPASFRLQPPLPPGTALILTSVELPYNSFFKFLNTGGDHTLSRVGREPELSLFTFTNSAYFQARNGLGVTNNNDPF